MSRIKATTPAAAAKRPKAVKKSAAPAKKIIATPVRAKRKAKPVMVDVIEDTPLTTDEPIVEVKKAESTWPSFGDKKENDELQDEEIDSQKKFYSKLAKEIKSEKDSPDNEVEEDTGKRSIGLYRRLVVRFLILVGVLALIVAYFSFSKLTVDVDLKGETINDNLLLNITDASTTPAKTSATSSLLSAVQDDPREKLNGSIKEIKTSVQKNYESSGESFMGDEVIGRVKLINNSPKSQALVAKTRLLSPDNKLFRLKNAVNIPASGEVYADIYADKPSSDMAIDPTNFTIPGLWSGLQDKIYGQSEEKFVFTQKVKKYVNASDLEHASQDISDALLESAKQEASNTLASGDWLYLSAEPATISIGAKNGDQLEAFTARATGKVVAVYFSRDEAAKLAAAKLNLIIPDDKELAEFKPENIAYSLESYDSGSKSATVKAVFTGTMILKSNAEVINPQQLVGLNENQINTYLKDQPEIKDYTLHFFPSFIKKAPSLVDRIKIQVNKD